MLKVGGKSKDSSFILVNEYLPGMNAISQHPAELLLCNGLMFLTPRLSPQRQFSHFTDTVHCVEDHRAGILDVISMLCVCASPGLRLLQVWRAADPQVASAGLPRHAGPRDRLV